MDDRSTLNDTLVGHKVNAMCTNVRRLENYDIFTLVLGDGCKIKLLENISREIQLAMKLQSPPVFHPDYSNGLLLMVAARRVDSPILLSSIIEPKKPGNYDCQLGYDMYGAKVSLDITKAPHILVSGTTGSGKSVCLNLLAANILAMGNGEATLCVTDPKMVEFEYLKDACVRYENDYRGTVKYLQEVVDYMEERYEVLKQFGCRDISDLPAEYKTTRTFIIIDEIADLMVHDKSGRLSNLIARLAAKSRAAGIHMILATQRPSVNVVSGLIKANFPVRITFRVASSTDSRVVIDMNGAENLMPKGDGIIFGYGDRQMVRFRAAYVTPAEVMKYYKDNYDPSMDYYKDEESDEDDEDVEEDDLRNYSMARVDPEADAELQRFLNS